jgi:hypothetical protein
MSLRETARVNEIHRIMVRKRELKFQQLELQRYTQWLESSEAICGQQLFDNVVHNESENRTAENCNILHEQIESAVETRLEPKVDSGQSCDIAIQKCAIEIESEYLQKCERKHDDLNEYRNLLVDTALRRS